VFRRWLLPCLLLSNACSDRPVRSGSLSLPGNQDSVGGSESEPTLVLRCQNGRVSAYLVSGSPAEIATQQVQDGAVEVQLDSAPPCSESAP
jgi:hypothetical protein